MIGLSNILGAGLQVGGAVVNAITGARSAARQRAELRKQAEQNKLWYNRRYNEVGTERADAKAALTAMREAQQQRVANAQGRSAVMGGSSAVGAMEKQAANNALGNTISSINAQQEQRKDAIENKYLDTENKLSNMRIGVQQQQQNNIANAVTNASKTAAQLFGAGIEEENKEKRKK